MYDYIAYFCYIMALILGIVLAINMFLFDFKLLVYPYRTILIAIMLGLVTIYMKLDPKPSIFQIIKKFSIYIFEKIRRIYKS